jgi:hypothetical protein
MEPKKPNKARFADPAAHIPYYMHRFAPSRVVVEEEGGDTAGEAIGLLLLLTKAS